MDSDGIWRVSPAYDVIYGLGVGALRHKSTLKGKSDYVKLDDIIYISAEYDISDEDIAMMIRNIMSVLDRFEEYADDIGIKRVDKDGIWLNIKERVEIFFD
jgi:hypothetical protein